METKIKLRIGTLTDLNQITNVLVTCLNGEYLIDSMRSALRKYSRDVDLKKQISDFANVIDRNYSASFASYEAWLTDKQLANNAMLELLKSVDKYLAEKEIITAGSLVDSIQNDMISFLLSLSTMRVTLEELDLTGVNISKEYLASAIEQLRLLDEGMLISNLASMELEFTPLDTKRDRNKFIEEKLNRLDRLTKSCQKVFDNDYDKLLNQILAMYDKFYSISYSSDTDGEKVEKARRILKVINSHRLLLDKLENKLAEANELKRQLTIHKKKVEDNLNEQKDSINAKLSENPEEQDILANQIEAKEFVAFEYSERITEEIEALTKLQEQMTEHYKVLDQLEISLKCAIPSEEDLNKYSSISHKFQELTVRLELDKSKPIKPSKELMATLNTAIVGLKELVVYANDFKDLFVRNSMLTAIFRAVNDLNDFATSTNKAEQLNQINFVASTLGKYNELEQLFNKNIVNYRRIANDTIRNISIIISKEINGKNIFEVIDMIDGVIKQFSTLYDNLSDNQKRQIDVMKEIMTL